MTSYRKHNVNLTEGQKEKLGKYFQKREPMTLRLSHNQLSGGDELLLTNTQKRKNEKSKIYGTGIDIKISTAQMRKQSGGNLFSALLPLARTALPQVLKSVGLSALTGAVAGGIEEAIKGEGLFSVTQNKADKLIQYKDYLIEAQKKQIVQALQTGSGFSRFRLTKKQQEGEFLGTLLAFIGIPLIMNALTGKGQGNGLHVEPHLPTNTRNNYVPKTRGAGTSGGGKAVWLRPSTTEPCICCKQVAEKPRREHLKNDVCMYMHVNQRKKPKTTRQKAVGFFWERTVHSTTSQF